MVQLLERPQSQTGEYSFDSNDCPEPGCPGPKQEPNGNLVCGQENTENPIISGGLGSAPLVNCIGLMMVTPEAIEQQDDEGEDESEEDSKPDLYIC